MCDKTVSRVTHSPSQCHLYQWSFLLDLISKADKQNGASIILIQGLLFIPY